MAHLTLGFVRLEETLSRLAEVHQKANSKQLSKEILDELSNSPILRDGDVSQWQKTANAEFVKYCDFSKLQDRVWDFMAPKSQPNSIEKKGENSYKVVVGDLSQGARWEVAEGSEIQPLSEVLSDPKLFSQWKEFFSRDWSSNRFSQWNRGFLYSGLCFKGRAETSYDIELEFTAESESNEFAAFHWMMDAGCKSRVRITENWKSEKFSGLLLYDRLCLLNQDAKVSMSCCEAGSGSSHIVQNTYSLIEGNASWTHFDLTLPSLWTRHNSKSSMLSPGANANLYGLYFGDEDFYCDHNTTVEHLSKETQSRQIYKGILDKESEAVFSGGVFIAEGASKSFSEQLNKNLLLSKKSEVHTKPELRIYNDDVKAAHGATVGQIDDDQLFYLQSRGLSKEQSWEYLMQAFVGEVLVELEDEDREFCQEPLRKIFATLKASDAF